jgi:MFS family permease
VTTPASSSPAAQPSPGPAPARRGWGAVSIVLVGAFMALLDVTIVNVALPSIRSGLHASPASLEWIVSGYALSYGLALVPGGRAGDRFGAKRLFLTGLTIFTLASVGCGIAQDQAQLVAARIVQGLGAGLFFPAIGATIQHTFTGPARSRAFGLLGAVIGVSTAIGPLLGGLIIAAAGPSDGWRWVFLVNLFVGAVAIPMAAWRLPTAATHTRRGFDPVGLGLLTGGLLLLLIPLVQGRQDGWPPGPGSASAAAWPCSPRSPPGSGARTGAAATRCSSRPCCGRPRSPPARSSPSPSSAASAASSSRCRSCGRWVWATRRWPPAW